MISKKQGLHLVLATVGAMLANLSSAHADELERNPLHPAYFMDRASADISDSARASSSDKYLDSGNPLHPMYARNRTALEWVAAAGRSTEIYVDSNNPLHPAYRRF